MIPLEITEKVRHLRQFGSFMANLNPEFSIGYSETWVEMKLERGKLLGPKSTVQRKEQFLKAGFDCRGNVSRCSDVVGINRRTFQRWMKDDTEFEARWNEVNESYLDWVVEQANVLIEGEPVKDDDGKIITYKRWPDSTVILATLRSRGKNRGYSERHEIGIEPPITFVHDSEAVAELIAHAKKL